MSAVSSVGSATSASQPFAESHRPYSLTCPNSQMGLEINDDFMDLSLLKQRFKDIKQETVDIAVSNINAYRGFIGNGVAVGKLAEPIFAKLLDAPEHGFHAFHFAFTGKNPPFDIMLYRASSEITPKRFAEVRGLFASHFTQFHDAISRLVGGNNWCGVSLKNYINEEAQISTNYQIRDLCEVELGKEERMIDDQATVKKVFGMVVGELSHETILFLNSFPASATYQIALFDPEEMRIGEIEYTTKTKHSRYIFCQDKSPVFHVKYGKNQANPYQRGLWVDDLSKLTILRKGNLRATKFGEFIVEGAFRIHGPATNSFPGEIGAQNSRIGPQATHGLK
jgi:hypothetical protein